jgi:hypothetical protein
VQFVEFVVAPSLLVESHCTGFSEGGNRSSCQFRVRHYQQWIGQYDWAEQENCCSCGLCNGCSGSNIPLAEPSLIETVKTARSYGADVQRGAATPAYIPHLGQDLSQQICLCTTHIGLGQKTCPDERQREVALFSHTEPLFITAGALTDNA